MEHKRKSGDGLPPPPAKITYRVKVGMTEELRLLLIRCARLSRCGHTVLIRQVLETEIPRRLARLEKNAA